MTDTSTGEGDATTPAPEIATRGALRDAGYRPRSVRDEIRANLIAALRDRREVFPGLLGYERSVIPQVYDALLSRHDFILLGLRGQAKTRLVRALPALLDEWMPVVAGAELHDDPFQPISKAARDLVAEAGDETPVAWVHRSRRYGEKLATPDTSIADLIGDVDPIKAATRKLTYADEETIHFGLVPRMHRGIFAINELPDLQPRIQVGLLGVMEEQDVQIRGFAVRLPVDVLMVFTANPEDYTNRGAIITPLKDRIASQILTHYPRELATGVEITRQEAWTERGTDAAGGAAVHVPHVFREIVEQVAFEARASEYVDQKSGVSARLTRAALEALVSAAERRAILHGEAETTVRASDLAAIEPAITGKVELVYEGEQEGVTAVAHTLVGRAVAFTMRRYLPDPAQKGTGRDAEGEAPGGRAAWRDVLGWFARGHALELDTDLRDDAYAEALERVDGLGALVDRHAPGGTPAERAAMMELALETLHQHSLLGKDIAEDGARFTDLVGSVLSGLGSFDPDDEDDDLPRRRL